MKFTRTLSLLATAAMLSWGTLGVATAQEPAPAAPAPAAAEPAAAPAAEAPAAGELAAPTIEQRVKDIEQYFNNLIPGADGDVKWKSNIAASPGPGHNGFLMICAALVLFMTLPGLALFYGGLVRKKNVLSVLAQCMGIAGIVTILWVVCGYSFVFAEGQGSWFGTSMKYSFLKDVTGSPNSNYTAWPSQITFSMYQLMFAIITPALIIGAIAERMKFAAVLAFVTGWMFLVYFPLAHMVWGFDGAFNGVWNGGATFPALDFAGGTVVHMSSGWSALVLCIILGKRLGFGKEKMAPHNMVLCMVGTGMLWVGWYGFNAGSALAADGIAANAFATTTIAAAIGGLVWAFVEWIHKGHPSILGFCSGIVAGLVVITPACGFVSVKGALLIGILAGIIPYLAVVLLKPMLGMDDALDTFGIHGIGGTMGAILTGVLASKDVNGNLIGANNAFVKAGEGGNGLENLVGTFGLVKNQLIACGVTIGLSVVMTVILALIIKVVIGLRPTPEVETAGLDINEHSEEGYDL